MDHLGALGQLRNHSHFQSVNRCRIFPPTPCPRLLSVLCSFLACRQVRSLSPLISVFPPAHTGFFPRAVVGASLIINISERIVEQALLHERQPPSWVPCPQCNHIRGRWRSMRGAPGRLWERHLQQHPVCCAWTTALYLQAPTRKGVTLASVICIPQSLQGHIFL